MRTYLVTALPIPSRTNDCDTYSQSVTVTRAASEAISAMMLYIDMFADVTHYNYTLTEV